MEKFEALADLVRTLSKRCEEFERHKQDAENYYRWYKEKRDKCEELQEQLDAIKNQHESFAKRFEVE